MDLHADVIPEASIPISHHEGSEFFWFAIENLTQWAFVFTIFMIELSITTFLISPVPVSWRRHLLNIMRKSWNNYPRARVVVKTVFFFVTVMMLDNFRRMYLTHATTVIGADKDINLALYAAQRNAFLCGTTLFLFAMLLRFSSTVHTIQSLEERLRKYDPNLPATWTESSSVGVSDRKEKIEPDNLDAGVRRRIVLEPIETK